MDVARGDHNQRMQTLRAWVVALLTLFAFLGHFNRISIAVVGNEQFIPRETLDAQQMGWIYFAFLCAYTATMIPAGLFIDRYGPTLALTFMGLGFGACVVLCGLLGLTGLTGSFLCVSLVAIRGLAGVCSAPLHPGAARAISLWLPDAWRTLGNGLVTAAAITGVALTYPLFGWLMDQVTWSWGMIIGGALLMGLAIVWWLTAADHADVHVWRDPGVPPTQDAMPMTRLTLSDATIAFLRLFRDRSLLLLSISYGAVGYFQYLFFYWIETYFDTQLHLSKDASRRSSAVVTLALASGMALGGVISTSLTRRCGVAGGRRLVAVIGMCLCAAFALVGVKWWSQSVVLCFSISFFCLGMTECVFWTTVTEIGGRVGGLAAAFLNTLGNATGSLAPVLTPYIMRRFGWDGAIEGACAFCALGGLLWLALNPAPRGEPASAPR